jgi:hypothetical protein
MFSKIREDIPESRCTTGINDIGDKIAAGINDRYQRHRWQIFPPFSLALFSLAWGKLIQEKKPEAKNLVTLSF